MSLVEWLLVIALLGALASLSVPQLHALWIRQRLRLATNELAQSLALVRAESQARGRAIRLCPSVDGRSCAVAAGWEQGWVALFELGSDRVAPRPLLVRQGWPGLSIRADTVFDKALRFNAQGWLRNAAGAPAFGRITVCPESGRGSGRQLIISRSGRVRQAALDCAGGGHAGVD